MPKQEQRCFPCSATNKLKFIHKNGSFELGKKTYIMGILNVTPDSFYDGGRYNSCEKALAQAQKMVRDGADIIDIGANSTRPDAEILSEYEELQIIREYVPLLTEKINTVFSVDTFYPAVAEYALNNGVSIINDVSGVFNEKMVETVKKHKCGYALMYNGRTAENNSDKISVTDKAVSFFEQMLEKCKKYGIPPEYIMLDSGIGFSGSFDEDIELIKNTSELKNKSCAYLTALSNKRVIKNSSGADGEDRVYGTLAANVLAVAGGTDFVRVHNVKENRLAINTADRIIRGK